VEGGGAQLPGDLRLALHHRDIDASESETVRQGQTDRTGAHDQDT